MSAPSNSGRQPFAALSTPRAVTNPNVTANAGYSGDPGKWDTIPGLGSAVKLPEITPQRHSKEALPLASDAPPASVRKTMSFPANGSTATAGQMPKTAGAAPADWQSFIEKRGTMSSAAIAGAATASPSASCTLQGLGSAPQSFSGTQATPSSANSAAIHFTQTKEYHTSITAAATTANVPASAPIPPHTAPLPQTGFSTFTERPASEKDDSSAGAFTEPTSSEVSVGQDAAFLDGRLPEQAGTPAPTWSEGANPRSLRNAMHDPRAEWEEAYPGALDTLALLNPPHYVMPHGTRVVNIKTDYQSNITVSIREGKYAAIDKVTERIMTIYKARRDARQKVIFLFSVNGSKKFCGVAEMSGEWDITGSINGWTDNPESMKVLGAIPVKWIYAKDVAYQHFSDIRQLHNGHPVGNMWNGMNFPTETGREVIERYVATPSTASVLGYPKNYPENFGVVNFRGSEASSDTRSSASQRSRGSFILRGAPRGGRGGMSRGGLNDTNWRPRSEAGNMIREHYEDDPTPTAANIGRALPSDAGKVAAESREPAAPTFSMDDLKNAPVADDDALQAGEPVSFLMGRDGRLMVVPSKKPPVAVPSSVFGESSIQGNQVPAARPLSDRGHHGLGLQGRGGPHATSGHATRNLQPSHAARPSNGHRHSSSVTMLQQAALYAAQQEEVQLRNHHANSMASIGFQNDGLFYPGLRSRQNTQMHRESGDGFDELPTPTHRPPPHATRQEASNSIPDMYRSVQGWQSDVVQGMGHLQLKAYFFTLAAEQHILQYQSMLPSVSSQAIDAMRTRMGRIVEIKRDIYDELYFMGHTLSNSPFDGEDFNLYQQPGGYSNQQRISPVRDDNGRVLPSASETSRSPPNAWNPQFRPFVQQHPQHIAQFHGHHQQQSMQSSASSMMGGGVDINGRRISS